MADRKDVIRAFTNHKPLSNGSALKSEGEALYSYAMLLAHWENGRIVYDYSAGQPASQSTRKHMNTLESIVPRA